MRDISLTQGKVALVDDADYERVSAFKWCAHRNKRTYYATRHVRKPDGTRTTQKMHNFIMGALGIDHANRDGLDNRRDNLRAATRSQNGANQGKREGTSSRFKGVYWHRLTEKWRAQIMLDKKTRSLGYFDYEVEAARAHDRAAIELFGPFAAPNFPATEPLDFRFHFRDEVDRAA